MRLITFLSSFLRRRNVESEIDEELRFHLDMETDAHRARGLSMENARRNALRDLGGVTQTREAIRAVREYGRPMKRIIHFYFENAVLLAVGVNAGAWFQRNPIDGVTALYYGLGAVAIVSARLAVVSYRHRADQAIASGT